MNSLFKSFSILVIALMISLNYCQNNLVINGDFSQTQGDNYVKQQNNQTILGFINVSIPGWQEARIPLQVGPGLAWNSLLDKNLVLFLNGEVQSSLVQKFTNLKPNAYYNLGWNWAPMWNQTIPDDSTKSDFQVIWNDANGFSTVGTEIPPQLQKSNLKVQATAQGQGKIQFISMVQKSRSGVVIDNVELRLVQQEEIRGSTSQPENVIEVLKKCNGFRVKCDSVLIWVAWYALCPYANFWGLGTYCPNIKIERF